VPNYLKTTDIAWHRYDRNESSPSEERYKLHFSVDPSDFLRIGDQISCLLDNAIDHRLIDAFKVYRVSELSSNTGENAELINRLKLTYYRDYIRQLHAPFVVYLENHHSEDYLFRIAGLIYKVERILHNIQPGNPAHRAPPDLPIRPHTIFRQATLLSSNNYIDAFNTRHGPTLISQALQSPHYQTLNNFVTQQAVAFTQRYYELSIQQETADKFNQLYDDIIHFVVNDVVSLDSSTARAAQIDQWIKALELLVRQKNFHGASAIYDALNDVVLKNLHLTEYSLPTTANKLLAIKAAHLTDFNARHCDIPSHEHPDLWRDIPRVESPFSINKDRTIALLAGCAAQENSFRSHVASFARRNLIITFLTIGLAALFGGIHSYRVLPASAPISRLPTRSPSTSLAANRDNFQESTASTRTLLGVPTSASGIIIHMGTQQASTAAAAGQMDSPPAHSTAVRQHVETEPLLEFKAR
jgi:hypothetical protein